MSSVSLVLPNLCAWCGLQPGSLKRSQHWQFSTGRRKTFYLDLPICAECAAYTSKTARLKNMWLWGTLGLLFLICMGILTLYSTMSKLPAGRDNGRAILILAMLIGLLLAYAFLNGFVEREVMKRNRAPIGYSTITSADIKLSADLRRALPILFKFRNAAFHREFARANPDYTWEA